MYFDIKLDGHIVPETQHTERRVNKAVIAELIVRQLYFELLPKPGKASYFGGGAESI